MSAFTEADYALINLGVCIKAQADRLGIEHEGVPLEGVVVRIAARALTEQGETEWEVEHGLLVKIGGNWAETEWEPEHFDEAVAGYPHNEYVRAERKVTPWLPVPGSTVRDPDSEGKETK